MADYPEHPPATPSFNNDITLCHCCSGRYCFAKSHWQSSSVDFQQRWPKGYQVLPFNYHVCPVPCLCSQPLNLQANAKAAVFIQMKSASTPALFSCLTSEITSLPLRVYILYELHLHFKSAFLSDKSSFLHCIFKVKRLVSGY